MFPPIKELSDKINLISRETPIPNVPYILGTYELCEIKFQLNELLDN
jgi:hypothetical protein